MKDDNTPTVNSRTRKIPPHMRLRLEKAKELKIINARIKSKKASEKEKKSIEGGPAQSGSTNQPKLKKNALNEPTKPPSKFRKRQIHKAWLPTHMYHTKRAHMTAPKEPLWRFAIPLTPTEKSYRATHRAAGMRGCIAWDMSYVSTIGIEGVEGSLLGVLRGLGVPEEQLSLKKGLKWRKGARYWDGWVRERDAPDVWISYIQIIWCAVTPEAVSIDKEPSLTSNATVKKKRRLFLRLHPSAFLQLWNELLKVAKIQKPSPVVEDLRFEIGSIEISGPGATEALVGALHPIKNFVDIPESSSRPENVWPLLASVTNPASLPINALLAFNISDPRLHHPPRTVGRLSNDDGDDLLQLLSTWTPDHTQTSSCLFERNARLAASRSLPSQKSINRRKSEALPGAYPPPLPKDPEIPVLLLTSRPGNNYSNQGSWTLLLPWKCVLPVWYSLMYYPLSSGRNPRFGGLREKRQLSFEQSVPWFPGDFPGTNAGREWEISERDKRRAEWEKRPKGKRIEWDSVDLGSGRKGEIGRGWACDWERLLEGSITSSASTGDTSNTTDTAVAQTDQPSHTELSILGLRHMHSFLSLSSEAPSPKTLITISITLIHRGVPTTCARIYRLPTTNPALRAKWLQQVSPPPRHKSHSHSHPKQPPRPPRPNKSAPAHELRTSLASSLLHPLPPPTATHNSPFDPDIPQAGHPDYPVVPGEEDLIGFITTGNFNLGEGRGTGIGGVVWEKVRGYLDKGEGGKGKGNGKGGLCIVREAGLGVGRIARWEVV